LAHITLTPKSHDPQGRVVEKTKAPGPVRHGVMHAVCGAENRFPLDHLFALRMLAPTAVAAMVKHPSTHGFSKFSTLYRFRQALKIPPSRSQCSMASADLGMARGWLVP
jgi:hypothetical protein